MNQILSRKFIAGKNAPQHRLAVWLAALAWPRRCLLSLLSVLTCLLIATQPAQAQSSPPSAPQLRIEAGMHTAVVWRISADASGRYAVTASNDKTARVWDVATGRLLQVLRPPIASGTEGRLLATSMAPNGETVAVAGWTGWGWYGKAEVYLFDRSTGQLRQRLGGLPNRIGQLAHSPDGRWLVATLGGDSGIYGIRVWPLAANGTAPQPSSPLVDSSYGDDSYGASFHTSGLLATTSWDGQVRLYRLSTDSGSTTLRPLAQVRAPGGQQPFAVAFAPNGQELAVGYADSTRVDVLDGQTLALRHTPSSSGVNNGGLSSVAWSADGQRLLAAGMWENVNGQKPVRTWPQAGRGQPVDTPTTFGTVQHLHPLPNGRVLVGAGDPMWGVLHTATSPPRWQALGTVPIADLRDSTKDFGYTLSANGQQVQFGYEQGVKAPHRFDVKRRSLQAGKDAALHLPRTSGLDVQNWINNTAPTLAGQPLKLKQYETARSLAQTPDAAPGRGGFALGAGRLRFFNASGQQQWEQPAPGEVWGVNIPPQGRVVVAAYADGTIRWHRLGDGQELLAFFPHADRKRWVLWTPSGYFDASVGSEDLIGWHVNRGADAAADFFPASQFRSQFYRPDVIDRVLDTLDEAEALKQADAARGSKPSQAATPTASAAAVLQSLPPVVEVLSGTELRATQASVTLRVRARTSADARVTGWSVRVNGQLQPEARGLGRTDASSERTDEREFTVTVPAQDSEIQVFATNRHATSTPAVVRVQWAGGKRLVNPY